MILSTISTAIKSAVLPTIKVITQRRKVKKVLRALYGEKEIKYQKSLNHLDKNPSNSQRLTQPSMFNQNNSTLTMKIRTNLRNMNNVTNLRDLNNLKNLMNKLMSLYLRASIK